MTRSLWLGFLAITLAVGVVHAQIQMDLDVQTLKGHNLPTDTEGLVDFFEQRSLKEGDQKVLEELVRELGSDAYRIREPAAKKLVRRGPAALPFLKAALKNSPLEMKRRAEICIRDIEATMQGEPISAAARVLAARQVPRAAEVLFNFLPSVTNDPFLEEEILSSVGRLTIHPGKVDPLILKALKDPLPFRRAVAAYLLGRRADAEQREALRELLADLDPLVQQRITQGLVGKRLTQSLHDSFLADETLLRTQKIDLTDAGVLDFFRKKALSDKDQQRLLSLVKDLGQGVYSVRVNATKQLIGEGPSALPFLRQVEFNGDVELSRRAHFCLEEIRRTHNTAIPIAAAHWLARPPKNKNDSPAEAIQVLLAYVPFADDEMVEEEILNSLTLLSLRETKVEPALRKALQDPMVVRRAAAAYVLGHVGTKEDVAKIQPLVDDINPLVRLRTAQGLLAARDKTALPCLVHLVQSAPVPYLNLVEDALSRLAGDKAPVDAIISGSAEARVSASKSWQKWLEANQAKIDLTNLADRETYLGLVTICEYNNQIGNIQGQVWETNRGNNQKRWNFTGVMGAMDAHTLPNGRVLVAENNANRITERDSKGEIKWEYRTPTNPICCQRLPNGNTFISTYNMVMEVTPNQTKVYSYTPGPQFYIFGAHKARNGRIALITAQNQILELDSKTGQTVNTVQLNTFGNWCSVELQPNGNYLVACLTSNNVREIDRKGQEVWTKAFPGAFRATRMPNGNVLVTSMNTREVAEIDRGGTIRWRVTCAGTPWNAHFR